jgi:hypothetical protein
MPLGASRADPRRSEIAHLKTPAIEPGAIAPPGAVDGNPSMAFEPIDRPRRQMMGSYPRRWSRNMGGNWWGAMHRQSTL